MRRCEEDITAKEALIAALQQQLDQPEIAAQYDEVVRISAELEQHNNDLEELFARWENAQAALESLI